MDENRLLQVDDDIFQMYEILDILKTLVSLGIVFKERDVLGIIKMAKRHDKDSIVDFFMHKSVIVNTYDGKSIIFTHH